MHVYLLFTIHDGLLYNQLFVGKGEKLRVTLSPWVGAGGTVSEPDLYP